MTWCAKRLNLESFCTHFLVLVLLSTEHTRAVQNLSHRISSNSKECSLNPHRRARIYDEASHVWTIADKLLRQLDNDLQKIIDCTKEDDILYFKTTQTITPKATMTIPWNLTITADPQTSTTTARNEDSKEKHPPVSFTCPRIGGVILSKSRWLTVSNVQFIECSNSGTIISVGPVGRGVEEDGQVKIHNVEFRNNALYSSQRILDFKYPYCSSLSMHNVVIRNNTCEAQDCIALPLKSTLTSIKVTQNSGNESCLASQAVFFLPIQSYAFATLVNASKNEIRVFGLDANATLKLIQSKFHDNHLVLSSTSYADVGGGVVYFKDSKVSIERCAFSSNTAPHGGVLFSIRSQVNISDCSFKGNLARGSLRGDSHDYSIGGALFISNSTLGVSQSSFDSNKAAYDGAALFAEGSTVTIQHTEVTRNKNEFAGTVLFFNCTVNLHGVLFQDNLAPAFGGGLVASRSDVVIEASRFVKNNATVASAVSLRDQSSATISRSSFSGNKAECCGALHIVKRSKVEIQECRFEENIASVGGAILILGENRVKINASHVSGNIARRVGGGVYIGRGAKFISTRTHFTGNKVEGRLGYGGGIFSDSSDVFLYSSNIESNSGKSGGGVYIKDASVRFFRCNFTNNDASENGGGLFFVKSSVHFKESFVVYSRALLDGGGIYAKKKTRLMGKDSTVFGNSAVEKGGGLALMNGSVYKCSSCNVTNNSAKIGPNIYQEPFQPTT